MKSKLKKFVIEYWGIITVFLVFITINRSVPVGGDDVECARWWSNNGILSNLLGYIHGWTYLNGRISNNFSVSLFSHFRLLWIVFSAVVQCVTIWSMEKVLNKQSNRLVVLMLILFLCVGKNFRIETQFHEVGNVSYTICCACGWFLCVLLINEKRIMAQVNKSINAAFVALAFILGIITSTWIENLTMAFDTSLLVLLIYFRRKREKMIQHKMLHASIAGALIGTIFMFSSVGIGLRLDVRKGVYETILNNLSSYVLNFVWQNELLLTIFSVTFILGLIYCRDIFRNRKVLLAIALVAHMGNILILGINILGNIVITTPYAESWIGAKGTSLNYLSILGLGMMFAFEIFVITISVVCISERRGRQLWFGLYLVALVSAAPMIFSPGARNMIVVIQVLIFYISYLAINICRNLVPTSGLGVAIKVLLCMLTLSRVQVYANTIQHAVKISNIRFQLIEAYRIETYGNNYAGDYILALPKYDENLLIGNFNTDYYLMGYIAYYKLPKETQLVFFD